MVVQRVPAERLLEELAEVKDPCDPPVPVWAWLDGAQVSGDLLGWAYIHRVGESGYRMGLVMALQAVAPGSLAERLCWIRADHIRPRRGG